MKFRTMLVGVAMLAGTVGVAGPASAANTTQPFDGVCRGTKGTTDVAVSDVAVVAACQYPDPATLLRAVNGPTAPALSKTCELAGGVLSGADIYGYPNTVLCFSTATA